MMRKRYGWLLCLLLALAAPVFAEGDDPVGSVVRDYLHAWGSKDYAAMKQYVYPAALAEVEKTMPFEKAMVSIDQYLATNGISIDFATLHSEVVGDDITIGGAVFHKVLLRYVIRTKDANTRVTGYLYGIHETADGPWYLIEDNEKMYAYLADKYPTVHDALPVDQPQMEPADGPSSGQ
jgi:hypothetical protein